MLPPALAAWQGETGLALTGRAEALQLPCLALPPADDSQSPLLEYIMRELERATAALYLDWLPGAEGIDTPGGAGLHAVKALARELAQRTNLFGPYLEAMSGAALRKAPEALARRFPFETSIRECFKLFCRAYGASNAVLIITLPDHASTSLNEQVQQAAIFIAAQNTFLVWIAGDNLERLVRIPLVSPLQRMASETATQASAPNEPYVTPLAGRPNPLSDTEMRLESFLLSCEWAKGRSWNARWSDGLLSNPVRVDLMWEAERLVVELDGLDHLAATKYRRDRQRDRALQAAGFLVLRFTNDEIADDLVARASEIERFLTRARAEQS